MNDYWTDTLNEILGQHGLDLSSEKIAAIASDVESAASVSSDYSPPVSARVKTVTRTDSAKLLASLSVFIGGVDTIVETRNRRAFIESAQNHSLIEELIGNYV